VNREAFEGELAQRGLPVRVESRERLAVLVPFSGAPALTGDTLRRDVQSLAVKHGFTHVAIELTEEWCSRAAVPRSQPE
jgi:hypothetical protein